MAALQVKYLLRSADLVSTSGNRMDDEAIVDVREWMPCVARMLWLPQAVPTGGVMPPLHLWCTSVKARGPVRIYMIFRSFVNVEKSSR